jgi:hypothetical protein
VVVCLPFFALAPHAFVHDVIVAQLSRHDVRAGVGLGERIRLLTGVSGLPGVRDSVLLAGVLLALLAAAVVVAFGWRWRRRTRLEWFALTSWVVTVAGMSASSTFVDHYAYLPAAFLAVLIGTLAGRAAPGLRRWLASRAPTSRLVPALAAAVVVALVAGLAVAQAHYANRYLSEASDPASQIAAVIPAGACVISDFPTDLILAKRYLARDPGCPAIADPFGLYLTDDDGSSPHLAPPDFVPTFQDRWLGWLAQADYVELRIAYSDFIPWSQDMISWFSRNYRLVAHFRTVYPRGFIDLEKNEYVYQRIGAAAG